MAVLFTATKNEVIDCGSPSVLDNIFSGGGTMMVWVYLNGFGGGGWGRVFDKAASTTPTSGWLWQTQSSNSRLSFAHSTSGTLGQWEATTALSTGTQYHFALTFNKNSVSNNPIFYFDGSSVGISETSTPTGTFDSDAGENLTIGNQDDVLSRSLDGIVEDARVYNRILSAAEIQTIYACKGHDGIVQGLQGRWPLNDGAVGATVSAVADWAPPKNNATGSGGIVFDKSILSFRRAV